ncbi:phosphatidylserine decarboxylase [Sediminicoccus sp. BL-A-41-H5]|uniref:phosphatidylserine decarboxylase n=1 Tax=Sediminicoccus sp. BL-A-41-H5 TaxID=3421106 RepID=UPI003D66E8F5
MSLANSLSLVLAPPHPAGRPFIYAGAGVALLGGLLLGSWLFWLGTAFTLFCLYFFRDPKRVPPARHDLVLAPADGRVVLVGPAIPPAELEMGDTPRWRVAIFLSVLDVHVNRSPVQGRISRISYRHGKFMDASLEKASEENERNALRFDLPDGRDLACVQIAGLVARRIVCTAHEGDRLMAGERFGIIRFGSRTDVYLPIGVKPLVLVGQTMIGGESILAELA